MTKTYFLAVDKPGQCYQGHGGYKLTVDENKVDIIWRSFGVKGDALEFFGCRDRTDRCGFTWHKTPPRKEVIEHNNTENLYDEIFHQILTRTAVPLSAEVKLQKLQNNDEKSISFTSRERVPGQVASYNIFSENDGRDYIIFSVEGENLKIKNLEDKVDLAYYAQSEDAYVSLIPWQDELLVRTRVVPEDKIRFCAEKGRTEVLESYEIQKKQLGVQMAIEEFALCSTLSDKIYKDVVKRSIGESLAMRKILKRERKEKKGFLSTKKVREIVPVYSVESLETLNRRHSLCAVVRGPFEWEFWELLPAD